MIIFTKGANNSDHDCIYLNMFCSFELTIHQRILKKICLKDHATLKTGVMAAENQLCITKIYYIKYITIYMSRHRLGDTEVSGQTRVFIEQDWGENQEVMRGEYCTSRQDPDGLAWSNSPLLSCRNHVERWRIGNVCGTGNTPVHTMGLAWFRYVNVDQTRSVCEVSTDIVELD